LPAPIGVGITQAFDIDAAGQATFQGSSDKIGRAFLARFRLVEIKRLFRESIQEGRYPLVLYVRVELGRFESVRSLVARNAQNPRSARELSVGPAFFRV
jgi:hypothetical protein